MGADAFLTSILDCVAQPVWVADHDGLIRFANPSAVATLGYDSLSALIGKPSHHTIHYKRPDGSPFPADECPLLLPRTTGETIYRADDWFVRRDGSMFPVEYWSAPMDGPDGRGAVVAFRDVSERRETETVLRERDAILSALGQPVYVGTPDGLITYANPAAVEVLGYSDASELIGQNGHWLIHYKRPDGSHYPIEECPLTRGRDTGGLVRIEEDWLVRKDGSMMPVACTAVPFEAPGGYGIAVSFTDLSIRLAAERAGREREIAEARAAELSAGEARHRAILAAALDGVIIIDQDGRVTYLNAAAERIFGYRADRVLGRELADAFLPPSAREAHRRGLTRYLASGQTHVLDRRIEVTAVRADGSEFPAELTVTRAGLPGAPAFIGYVRDITERQRAEEDLLTARQRLKAVADEQAALRRVATLVASGASQEKVFAVVAEEVAGCLDLPLVSVIRFEASGTAVHVGAWGRQNPFAVGTSWQLDEHGASGRVYRSGRSARVDYAHVPGPIAARLVGQAGIRSAVAVPIIVNGRPWGAMMALSTATAPQPASTEARLASFTELVATAIANAEAHQELRRLADEQAALRQVATLVAQGAEQTAVFDAVCEVTGRLFGAASVNLAQFTADEMNLTQAGWSQRGTHVPPGTRLPLDGESINALIRQAHAPVRVDSYEGRSGRLAARLRELGIQSEVGAPVVVDGEVWGALIAGTDQADPLPPGTEERVASFAELIGTAVSNATARAELIASRARMVTASDAARRRVTRDLHDGAQQQLVSTIINLQLAQQSWSSAPERAREYLNLALRDAGSSINGLREIAAGIHPAILTLRGLAAALDALADRLPMPVRLDVTDRRLSAPIEASVYFFCSEALTNVVKHAKASSAWVRVAVEENRCTIEVGDDGIGGAEARLETSGLIGLRDRIGALKGAMHISSPPSSGTALRAWIPLSYDTAVTEAENGA
ncbi:MAG TPA: PAS domain S-box protein [Streptosporangiaceae bacterium]|nr:PAS domain S-box protein [Streptosporangiaceae bacterium]